jgi:5'-nucleotidase
MAVPMHFLLSNDDGYNAPGLRCISGHLDAIGDVTVVAPDRNRSGASNSLTLEHPLRVQSHGPGVYSVDGTPTDCVHLAITGLLDDEPDMVVSGINMGGNLGDDVLYSGTVAGAMEGRFLGLPAIAVSIVSDTPKHYDTAARAVCMLIHRLVNDPLPADTILNVNVPDLAFDDIAGFEATRLGHRHRSAPAVRSRDPRGNPIWWVGPVGGEADAGPGTDFHAIAHGFVSVTPLQVDLTRYGALDKVAGWLGGVHD